MKNKCEAQNRPKNARSEQKPFLANFGTGMRATKELLIGQQFLVEKGLVKCVELQPKTRKIVVSADSEQLINLEELSERTNAIYEPDQN